MCRICVPRNGTIALGSDSILGERAGDRVGSGGAFEAGGNAVVVSPFWDDFDSFSSTVIPDVGAVTWIDGVTGRLADNSTDGFISTSNSLTGEVEDDMLGSGGVVGLPDGGFLVGSPSFEASGNDNAGEVHLVRVNGGHGPGGLTYGNRPNKNVTVSPTKVVALLSAGQNLVMQANTDITVNAFIEVDAHHGTGGHWTMQAGRSILINEPIVTDNGDLTLIANDLLANGVVENHRDFGAAEITMDTGTYIDAGTGTVTIELRDGADRGTFSSNESGDITLNAITAGELHVTNAGLTDGSDIFQAGGAFDISGVSSFSATGNVTVDNTNNLFRDTVTLAGDVVDIAAQDFLRLAPTGTDVWGLQVQINVGELHLLAGTYDTSLGGPGAGGSSSGLGGIHIDAGQVRLLGDVTLVSPASLDLGNVVTGPGALTIQHDGETYAPGSAVTLGSSLGVDPSHFVFVSPPDDLTQGPIGADGALGGLSISSTHHLNLPTLVVNGDVDIATVSTINVLDINVVNSMLVTGAASLDANGNINFGSDVSTDTLLALAGVDLTISNGALLEASGIGDALVLVAGNDFINNFDSTALDAVNGRWLVHSTSPADSTENGLAALADATLPRLYNQTFAGLGTITQPGNHLIYVFQPALTLTADDATRTYGAADPLFTFSAIGFVTDDGVTDPSSILGGALATTAVANSSPGLYSIDQGTLDTAAEYLINFTAGEFSITPAALLVTADDAARLVGEANPTFSATVTGYVLGEDASALGGVLALTTPATPDSPAGVYPITPSGLTSTNYTITYVNGQLTVSAPPPEPPPPEPEPEPEIAPDLTDILASILDEDDEEDEESEDGTDTTADDDSATEPADGDGNLYLVENGGVRLPDGIKP